jgi:hypothetical protein
VGEAQLAWACGYCERRRFVGLAAAQLRQK